MTVSNAERVALILVGLIVIGLAATICTTSYRFVSDFGWELIAIAYTLYAVLVAAWGGLLAYVGFAGDS